jgi:hypothetical protein
MNVVSEPRNRKSLGLVSGWVRRIFHCLLGGTRSSVDAIGVFGNNALENVLMVFVRLWAPSFVMRWVMADS